MKKIIISLVLFITLVGSVFSAERKIKISQKVEEGKIPQTVVSVYDADYLAAGKFDKEIMTNYFITIFENKNGTIVQCKSVGKDAEFFTVIEKEIPENVLVAMFTMDFDKTWNMIKDLGDEE